MQNLSLKSNAKVNLALDVLGKAKNGFHYIQTIIHEITPENTHGFIPDVIHVRVSDAKKWGRIKLPEGFTSYDGTLFKAANLIFQKYCKDPAKNIEIEIEKNIPVASGLGGGSSNGATVLKALNELLGLHLTTQELESMAAQIGMDAPFFIRGGVALCENFGEKVTPLPEVKGLAFTLITQEQTTQTQNKTLAAYAALDLAKCGLQTDKTIALLHAIKTNDAFAIHSLIHNDFETLLKKPLNKNHHLSGSGPTQFILA